MSMFRSPISMAVLVTFFYILITWSLYHQWESSVQSFIEGATATAEGDDFAIGAALANAPQKSLLLNVLLFPIPSMVAAAGNGLISFWSVALQGLLLGGVAYLSVKARLIRKG